MASTLCAFRQRWLQCTTTESQNLYIEALKNDLLDVGIAGSVTFYSIEHLLSTLNLNPIRLFKVYLKNLRLPLFTRLFSISRFISIISAFENPLIRIDQKGKVYHIIYYSLRYHICSLLLSPLFSEIAKRHDVLVINASYDIIPASLIEAFSANDKYTIEYQHGRIHQDHTPYSKLDEHQSYSPDLFLAWDNYSAFQVNHSNIIISSYSNLCLEYSRSVQESVSSSPTCKKISILITLDYLAPVPLPLLGLLVEYSRFNWIIRFHPISPPPNAHELYSLLGHDNITIDLHASYPLDSLLRSCQLHITPNSSVAYQASFFNVSTFFYDKDAKKSFQHLFPVVRYIEPARLAQEFASWASLRSI